jgi:poly-gamma-glutamate biosynthesis protein PgsC/CapC
VRALLDNIIILGIIMSIIFYEITEISPGGIIVPGYLVLFLGQPLRILMTVIVSIITLYLVRILSDYTILYGKRKFAMMIMISFCLRYFLNQGINYLEITAVAGTLIGNIIPGIIAHEFDRQGVVKTLSALIVVGVSLKLILILLGKGLAV